VFGQVDRCGPEIERALGARRPAGCSPWLLAISREGLARQLHRAIAAIGDRVSAWSGSQQQVVSVHRVPGGAVPSLQPRLRPPPSQLWSPHAASSARPFYQVRPWRCICGEAARARVRRCAVSGVHNHGMTAVAAAAAGDVGRVRSCRTPLWSRCRPPAARSGPTSSTSSAARRW
jgi:hypothetical protein